MESAIEAKLWCLRTSLIRSLEEQISAMNRATQLATGSVLSQNSFPSQADIDFCWHFFISALEKDFLRVRPILDLSNPKIEVHSFWTYCFFGLNLYHRSDFGFPIAALIFVLHHEKEMNDQRKMNDQRIDKTELTSFIRDFSDKDRWRNQFKKHFLALYSFFGRYP